MQKDYCILTFKTLLKKKTYWNHHLHTEKIFLITKSTCRFFLWTSQSKSNNAAIITLVWGLSAKDKTQAILATLPNSHTHSVLFDLNCFI